MSFQAFHNNFPQMPLVDPKTGLMTKDGRLLLTTMWQRTGGGTGIVPIVNGALTAAGTTQQNALGLTGDWNNVETVASGTGVVMPTLKPGNDITVRNSGSNPLNVYPFPGSQINANAINAPHVVAPGVAVTYQCWSTTQVHTT